MLDQLRRQPAAKAPRASLPRRLGRDQALDFTEGLASLLAAGLRLENALDTLTSVLEKPRLKAVAAQAYRRVREGRSLWFSLREMGGLFDEAYLGMVRAGEKAGTLAEVLDHLADGLRRRRDLTRTLASSLLYPLVLLAVSAAAVGFILVYVLPTFAEVFQDMHMPLPPAARALLWLGQFMEAHGWQLLAGWAALLAALAWALKRPGSRRALERLWLRMGPLGRLAAAWQTVIYCRTLGLLIKGGVQPAEASAYAAAAPGNLAFREPLAGVAAQLKEGGKLSQALARSPYMPPLALRLVSLGEETADMGGMLLKAADYLEGRLKTTLSRLVTLIEPLIILGMGVVVGLVVMTMLTTIFSLTQGGL